MRINIIGAGLAGCEAALYLAKRGVPVTLYEQKPHAFSPAHHSAGFAELVCSNSLKAERLDSASGLLKAEMELLGSSILPAARACSVPAGGALAVDRDAFSARVTRMVEAQPGITVRREEVTALPAPGQGITLVASGPLTQGPLAAAIAAVTGHEQLAFYDAAAPIVTAQSLDMTKVFAASRYGRGTADYLNCPFDKARYGPLRPVGLINPATGHRPWANVQLRAENAAGTLYNLVGFQTNLKFGEQKRVFSMIPGLAHAEFARYGVMHRNTFLNSPKVLTPGLCLKTRPDLFFAGQITGFEGYMESAASGLLAARAIAARLAGEAVPEYPAETMCGALLRYITSPSKDFQPMGANMGILPPLEARVRDKRQRYLLVAQRAVQAMRAALADV